MIKQHRNTIILEGSLPESAIYEMVKHSYVFLRRVAGISGPLIGDTVDSPRYRELLRSRFGLQP